MALFDIFKRKKSEPAQAPEVKTEVVEQAQVTPTDNQPAPAEENPAAPVAEPQSSSQAEVTEGLKKTKEGFFGKLARAVATKVFRSELCSWKMASSSSVRDRL